MGDAGDIRDVAMWTLEAVDNPVGSDGIELPFS